MFRRFAPTFLGRLTISWAVITSIGLLGAASEQRMVRVTVPSWATDVRCGSPSETIPAVVAGDALEASCPAKATDLLACDGPTIEPHDIAVTALCDSRQLPLTRGRTVLINDDRNSDAIIQWLSISRTLEIRVVATRALKLSAGTVLRVADVPNRHIAVRRRGMSPLTVPASRLFSQSPFPIPAMPPGAEILLAAEPSAVMPVGVRIQGFRSIFKFDSPFATFRGVHPGHPRLLPVYEGGLDGYPIDSRLVAGDTTAVFVRKEAVGGAVLVGDSSKCGRATSLTVQALDDQTRRPKSNLMTLQDVRACRWNVDGLRPGLFRAFLSGPHGSGGRSDFQVLPQVRQLVKLVPPRAFLSGRLWFNGRPLSDVEITAAGQNALYTVRANEVGAYELALDEPGRYSLTVRRVGERLLPSSRIVDVKAGSNSDEWRIHAGSITVRLFGRAPGYASVRIRSSSGLYESTLAPGVDVVTREGLPLGEYRVSATQAEQPRPLVSNQTAVVTLTPDAISVLVDLRLIAHSATLRLRDAHGQPLAGARLSAGRELLRVPSFQPQVVSVGAAAGEYSLAGFPPGTELLVEAGPSFSPLCRTVTIDNEISLRVPRGVERELEFTQPGITALSPQIGHLLGVHNSDCPVPLSSFTARLLPASGGRSRFLIQNFPPQEKILWETFVPTHRRVEILVPDVGRILFPLR